MAKALTVKPLSMAVCWYKLLMTTLAMASRLISITTRVFSSDSSRTAVMSVMTFSLTSSAMRSTRPAVDVVLDGGDDLLAVAFEFFDAHFPANFDASRAFEILFRFLPTPTITSRWENPAP